MACEAPRLSGFIEEMKGNISGALGLDGGRVSIKATTEEGLGTTGTGAGISAYAVTLLEENEMTALGVRTRFGPSPTGELHIGSLRTALFNWLFARHSGGSLYSKDRGYRPRTRSRAEFESSITEDLHWLGLDPDEGPYRQSNEAMGYI